MSNPLFGQLNQTSEVKPHKFTFFSNILLLFWSANVLVSICFGSYVTMQNKCSTRHRWGCSACKITGVAAVGVGDSVAAIYSSLYGTTKWPWSKKTVGGSSAMAASIVVFLALARPFCAAPVPSHLIIIFTALILAAIEAFTVTIDNIALPVVGYLLLH
ncbi:hypothetical protein Aduo_008265 [Ancylostoma duodenale]